MNELDLFLESCRSQETKHHYQVFLQKFLDFPGPAKTPKDIEKHGWKAQGKPWEV